MAYTKHNWVCGEVINDTKMNNIETGIEEAIANGQEPGLLISYRSEGACDGNSYIEWNVTYADISDAINSGKPIFFDASPNENYTVLMASCRGANGKYVAYLTYMSDIIGNNPTFTNKELYSDTEDGYMRDYNCWGGGGNS